LECSWVPLSFSLWIVDKLLCSCLCLLDAIIDLHAMDEKIFNDFFIGKGKWVLYVINLISFLYFVYVVEAFITLH
jgi:hypothetical protein